MLVNLHVKNLALMDEADIEFESGLNILTGETGAGKSILLGAMGIALGQKVPKEMLRDNDKEALVEVVFHVTKDEQRKQLQQLEIECFDDEVILSRKITSTRSIAKINGESVPAMKMKQVGDIFLDIHGQHEHQSLLNEKKHLEMLDEYAKEELLQPKEALKQSYADYISCKEEYENAALDDRERIRELEFLHHEVEELENAHLILGEDEQLEEDYKRLSNGQKIMEAVSEAGEEISGRAGASDAVGRAIRCLRDVEGYDLRIAEITKMLSEVDDLINDANRDLSDYIEENDYDGKQFEEIESRLNLINHLKAKYGWTLEEVIAACQEKRERIEKLEAYDTYIANLKGKLDTLTNQVKQDSMRVSDIRKQQAKKLVEQVKAALLDLNFLDVQFDMAFGTMEHFTANGMDVPVFMISTNPGEPIKPLSKIASGGEMSRIMLAIKTVLAENDQIDTLIFDEIDTGISGRTAQAVSEKLSVVARDHQVICITHLPQIAAMADVHYMIEKSVENAATISKIYKLSDTQSIDELARMLGGTAITDAVRENAREMKHLAELSKQ